MGMTNISPVTEVGHKIRTVEVEVRVLCGRVYVYIAAFTAFDIPYTHPRTPFRPDCLQ